MLTLSAAQARRIALAAQGFAEPRPRGRVDARHVRRVLARTGLLQIDSVNVVARAQYLPPFSRLGPYPATLLDDLAYRRRELFEYWGHEASLIPVADYPLFRWRMERAARGETWGGIARFARDNAAFVERVYAEVAERGPLGAGELSGGHRRSDPWWGWGDAKRALEWLFWTGRVATATRRRFERIYDLAERVIPAAAFEAPAPPEEDAKAELLRRSARALGVATQRDLADYYRLRGGVAPLIARLVDEGALVPARVEGWSRPAYLDPNARVPRRVRARALLAPFDPLVWERARTERIFGFRYRIEIYVPAARRVHGYYVLPFLCGDGLAARVDLKADRARSTLLVRAAHGEAGIDAGHVASELAAELRSMAGWLGLDAVRAEAAGDLAPELRRSLSVRDAR